MALTAVYSVPDDGCKGRPKHVELLTPNKEYKNLHLFGIYMISITKMHGCETWSLTLREEYRLMVFENRVLRRVFGPKRDEVTGEWRKLHNEELSDLYFTFLYSLIHTFLHLSLFFYSHISSFSTLYFLNLSLLLIVLFPFSPKSDLPPTAR